MKQNNNQLILASALVVFAAILKAATHPFTIDPIIAISLFSGAMISNRKLAFLMPLTAMFISDLMLEVFKIDTGFYGMSQLGNYASLLFITLIGFAMKKQNAFHVIGFSLLSSMAFFVLSNTNCFLFDNGQTYARSITGWAQCLAAGLPFVKNGLVLDLCFSIVLFGGYQAYQKWALKKAQA
jgi:hypothetical protein